MIVDSEKGWAERGTSEKVNWQPAVTDILLDLEEGDKKIESVLKLGSEVQVRNWPSKEIERKVMNFFDANKLGDWKKYNFTVSVR